MKLCAAFLLILFPLDAQAADRVRCVRNSLRQYPHGLRTEGLRRLFHRPVDPMEEALDRRWSGFLVETNPADRSWWRIFNNSFQALPRRISQRSSLGKPYDLRPIRAISRKIERSVLPKGRRFTLPVMIGTSIVTFPLYGPYTVFGAIDRGNQLLEKRNQDKKLKLLTEDPRFFEIQSELESGAIDREKALEELTAELAASHKWKEFEAEFIKSPPSDPLPVVLGLLSDPELQPLLGSIGSLIRGELGESSDFKKLPAYQKVFKREQILEIFDQESQALFAKDWVSTWLSDKAPTTDDVRQLFAQVEKDRFAQKLKELQREKSLDSYEAAVLLIQDITWRTKLAQWELAGLRPLIDGREVSLNEIRDGLLAPFLK